MHLKNPLFMPPTHPWLWSQWRWTELPALWRWYYSSYNGSCTISCCRVMFWIYMIYKRSTRAANPICMWHGAGEEEIRSPDHLTTVDNAFLYFSIFPIDFYFILFFDSPCLSTRPTPPSLSSSFIYTNNYENKLHVRMRLGVCVFLCSCIRVHET